MDNFIIIAHARTGSTWLSTSLASHPHIASGGEIFSKGNYNWKKWKKIGEGGPEDYLDYVYSVGRRTGRITNKTKICGYKILYGHDVKQVDVKSFVPKETKVIHLKRRRHLMSLTSQILTQKARWALARNPWQTPYEHQECFINKKQLERISDFYKEREKKWEYFDEVFEDHSTLEIWYEQMCEDTEKTHNKVLDFLGIERQPLESRMIKQRDKLLREIIINYEEASQYLIKAL
tara:strand:- start:1462 stop:2163 length:702 start_codon:yes stop_codon:yes gene_type:complete